MHETTIHLARLKDARKLAEMSRDLIEIGLGWRWRPRRIAQLIRNPNACAIIAVRQRKIVGFAIMQFVDTIGQLMLLAVDPTARRTGTGRMLLAWQEKSARAAGLTSITLQVRAKNAGARRFYKTVGYQEVATLPHYYKGREHAIQMCCKLVPAASTALNLSSWLTQTLHTDSNDRDH